MQLAPRLRELDVMLACSEHWLGRVSLGMGGGRLTDPLDGGRFLVEGLRHGWLQWEWEWGKPPL